MPYKFEHKREILSYDSVLFFLQELHVMEILYMNSNE